jgi:hypothetical protein
MQWNAFQQRVASEFVRPTAFVNNEGYGCGYKDIF